MPNNKVLVIGSGKDLDCILGEGIASRGMDAIMCAYNDDMEDIVSFYEISEAYVVINKRVIKNPEKCEKYYHEILLENSIHHITIYTSMPSLEEK